MFFRRTLQNPGTLDILNYELIDPLNRKLGTNIRIEPDSNTFNYIKALEKDLGPRNFPEKFLRCLAAFADWYGNSEQPLIHLEQDLAIDQLIEVQKVGTSHCKQAPIFVEFIIPALEYLKHKPKGGNKFNPFIKNIYHRTGLIQFTVLAEQYAQIISGQRWLFHSASNYHFDR